MSSPSSVRSVTAARRRTLLRELLPSIVKSISNLILGSPSSLYVQAGQQFFSLQDGVSRIRVARTSARFLSKISTYTSYAIVNWPGKVDESGSFKPHMSWGEGQRLYSTLCNPSKD